MANVKKVTCRCCQEKVNIADAGHHLLTCRPEGHESIREEFKGKESFALQVAKAS